MPKLSSTLAPKYRKHKASGQAIVTIQGKDTFGGISGRWTKSFARKAISASHGLALLIGS